MRRCIFSISAILLICVQFAVAQTVNISDSHFLDALIFNGIDKNKNSQIEVSEALACDSLAVNTTFGITDLTGIEAFINLRILNCSQNSLTNLDVSKNTKLTRLFCGYNKIKSLDVSNNKELIEFDCLKNSFLVLDISKNTKLERLYVLYNNITTIDLYNNPSIEYIDAGWSKLTTLDVSKNPKLAYLDVRGNTDLSSICVFDTNYAKSNLKFKKDATQKWIQNCTVTSIANEKLETNSYEQIIYPNPTYEEAYLKIPNLTVPIQLKVKDMSGKIMYEQLVNTPETEINTSLLLAGTYYLSFFLNNKVINKKLVVVK